MVLGIPLLPLLAVFQLGDKSLSVGLIQLDNLLQLLHEEQLQHSLVRVQVSQLEELPLQNVVVFTSQGLGHKPEASQEFLQYGRGLQGPGETDFFQFAVADT